MATTSNINIVEIEKYIRDLITKNSGVFDRHSIMMQSNEWMQKFPVEFNSILNFIENEGTNDMMDDSTPSVAYHGGGYADDSTPSVAYHGGGYADDSTPSVAYHGGGYADEYSGNIMPDHMSSVSDSPMGSDHIDSSPGCDPNDDFESEMPLQRTMSYAPPRK